MTYDRAGRERTVQRPHSRNTQTPYTLDGLVRRTVDPKGRWSDTGYYADGNGASTTDAATPTARWRPVA